MSFGFVQSKCLANILLRYFLFEFILSIFDLFISDKYTLPPELIILFWGPGFPLSPRTQSRVSAKKNIDPCFY